MHRTYVNVILLKDTQPMFELAALGRSNSTPGLVETKGQVPIEEMWVSPVEPDKPTVLTTASLVQSRVPTVPIPSGSASHHHVNPTTSNSSLHSSEEDKSNKTGVGASGLTPKINFYTSGKQICGQIHMSYVKKPDCSRATFFIKMHALHSAIKYYDPLIYFTRH